MARFEIHCLCVNMPPRETEMTRFFLAYTYRLVLRHNYGNKIRTKETDFEMHYTYVDMTSLEFN